MTVKNCVNLSISPWIRRFSNLVPDGASVLDLAAGGGRHAVWFADRGCDVTALDHRIDDLKQHCATLSPDQQSRLAIIQADLEDGSPWPLQGRQFDAVLVVNYLHRPLFPNLLAALPPGGLLLYETFAVGQERLGKPSNPDFLLRPGELLDRVREDLQVVAFEQGRFEGLSGPAVKQRLAAIKSSAPQAIAPP